VWTSRTQSGTCFTHRTQDHHHTRSHLDQNRHGQHLYNRDFAPSNTPSFKQSIFFKAFSALHYTQSQSQSPTSFELLPTFAMHYSTFTSFTVVAFGALTQAAPVPSIELAVKSTLIVRPEMSVSAISVFPRLQRPHPSPSLSAAKPTLIAPTAEPDTFALHLLRPHHPPQLFLSAATPMPTAMADTSTQQSANATSAFLLQPALHQSVVLLPPLAA